MTVEDEDPDTQEWADLVWMKYGQRLDVDDRIRALLDRRAAEQQAFEELTAILTDPATVRVVFSCAEGLDERLARAGRARIDTRNG